MPIVGLCCFNFCQPRSSPYIRPVLGLCVIHLICGQNPLPLYPLPLLETPSLLPTAEPYIQVSTFHQDSTQSSGIQRMEPTEQARSRILWLFRLGPRLLAKPATKIPLKVSGTFRIFIMEAMRGNLCLFNTQYSGTRNVWQLRERSPIRWVCSFCLICPLISRPEFSLMAILEALCCGAET